MPKEFEEMRKKISANLKGKTNPRTKKPYSESDIYAIAVAQWKKSHGGKAPSHKETKLCLTPFEYKEEKDRFISEGFIATTHPDRARDPNGRWKGDIITEEMIDKIVDTINNNTMPEAKYCSYRHDWIKQDNPSLPPAGIAMSAEKRETGDGHYGAWVTTEHLKTFPDYDTLVYDIEHKVIPGYSIEYNTKDFDLINVNGDPYRLLKEFDFYGYGFANARLQSNPKATITSYSYKELKELINKSKMEELKMQKAEKKEEDVPSEPEDKPEEQPEEMKEKKSVETKIEVKEFTVSKEDFDYLQKLRTTEMKEKSNKEIKELIEAEIKERIKAPLINPDKKLEMKELEVFKKSATVEYKELDEGYKHATSEGQFAMDSHMGKAQKLNSAVTKQYKEAAQLCKKLEQSGIPVTKNWKEMSESGMVNAYAKERLSQFDVAGDICTGNEFAYSPFAGTRLEAKESYWSTLETKGTYGLGAFNTTNTNVNLTDASWTYGSYYQSPVELNDIYGPALINHLNDQTVTWGKLKKENWSGRSQIQFRARTGRNATATGTSEGTEYTLASFTSYVSKDRFQQPFCYYHVLVAVTGQMIQLAQAPGGMGDVWGIEMENSMKDLVKALNAAIISTGDGTSESASLGFEGLILGTTGTLYGRNIATYTTLKSHKESYGARLTLDEMRLMIEKVTGGDTTITNSNANVSDLVFFCHPTQARIMKSIFQNLQRTVPTSARIGYEGAIDVDGVPVFQDPAMNTDDLFLIDTAHTKLAINLGPTVEYLPIAFDGKAGHIKIYFNLYSDAPSNNYWAHTLATS